MEIRRNSRFVGDNSDPEKKLKFWCNFDDG